MLFERFDNFDAWKILIGGPITEVEEQIEPLGDQSLHLSGGAGLVDQRRHMPVIVRKKGTRITGPVVLGEGVGVEVLCGEQADAQEITFAV